MRREGHGQLAVASRAAQGARGMGGCWMDKSRGNSLDRTAERALADGQAGSDGVGWWILNGGTVDSLLGVCLKGICCGCGWDAPRISCQGVREGYGPGCQAGRVVGDGARVAVRGRGPRMSLQQLSAFGNNYRLAAVN